MQDVLVFLVEAHLKLVLGYSSKIAIAKFIFTMSVLNYTGLVQKYR